MADAARRDAAPPQGGGTAAERAATRARLADAIAAVQSGSATTQDDATAEAPLPDGGPAALSYLVRSTSQRPLTEAEAAAKLRGRDIDADVVDAVIERARATGVLDDRAFAAAWVQDRGVKRGYGRQRLLRELRRRQVPEPIADEALAALDDHDEVAQATELARARAQRMPASLEPVKVASRLVGFLVRRGFPSHVAHDVARRVTAVDRDWD